MKQEIFIPGVLPGMNDIIAAAKRRWTNRRGDGYTAMKLKETTEIYLLIKQDKLRPMGRCKVTLTWQEASYRRDPDNIRAGSKFILDALVKAGVLPSDRQAHISEIHDVYVCKPESPGVLITLEAV